MLKKANLHKQAELLALQPQLSPVRCSGPVTGSRVENRSWPTNYRGRLTIHAGKSRPTEEEIQEIEAAYGVKIPRDQLIYGAAIGEVDLLDCVTAHRSQWFEGPYGFVLANAKPVTTVYLPGQVGIFNLRRPHKA